MTRTTGPRSSVVEDHKEDILNKLRVAGKKGLTKAGLGLHSVSKRRAFQELDKSGEIVNLGNRSRHLWVLEEFNDPRGMAMEVIEKNSHAGGLKLLIRQDLFKNLYGKIRAGAEKALKQLVKEGRVIILKRKSIPYYIHASHLSRILADFQSWPEPKESPAVFPSRERVLSAYTNIRAATGFSNIEIARLREELGVDLAALKEFILEECRRGRAVINPGDWSLSSDRVREAAILVRGVPHTYVRFHD